MNQTKTVIPQATLTLTSQSKVRYQAKCPEHETFTSVFLGPQEDERTHRILWAFRCRGKGGHKFLAQPDRNAPKNVDEVPAWIQKMKSARITETEQKKGRSMR